MLSHGLSSARDYVGPKSKKASKVPFFWLKMEITTLEELKQLRDKLRSGKVRIGGRGQDFNFENGSSLEAKTTNELYSTTTQAESPSLESNSLVPSIIEYEKFVRDYFTNNLHSKSTFPMSSYELLKR